jgi:hypothetical protein
LGGQKIEKENMLALAIAMGTVVWAVIGYALLSPNPPAPDGAGRVAPSYQVFVERDGNFSVVLDQMGALVRTATGFDSKASAQDWIAREENADNPLRKREPAHP